MANPTLRSLVVPAAQERELITQILAGCVPDTSALPFVMAWTSWLPQRSPPRRATNSIWEGKKLALARLRTLQFRRKQEA